MPFALSAFLSVLMPIDCRWVLTVVASRLKTPVYVYFVHPLHTDPPVEPVKAEETASQLVHMGMQHAQLHRRPTASSRCRLVQRPAGDIGAWSWDVLKNIQGLSGTTSLQRRRVAMPCRQTVAKLFPRLIVGFPPKTCLRLPA